jgi:hypothetical protein
MKKYEYLDAVVLVPTGWHEVTVAIYDQMWTIKPKTARERAGVVAIACGVDLQIFLDWPREVFKLILADVDFLFIDNPVAPSPAITIGNAQYNVAIEEKLTFGEYIDVDHVQKNSDSILSNVLAIICRPAGEKYDPINNDMRAAMFGALAVSQVQGVLAFFLAYWQLSTQRMRLFDNLQTMVDQLPPNIGALVQSGASIKLLQIWPTIKYGFLIWLLRARLRKYSPFYYTNATNAPQN